MPFAPKWISRQLHMSVTGLTPVPTTDRLRTLKSRAVGLKPENGDGTWTQGPSRSSTLHSRLWKAVMAPASHFGPRTACSRLRAYSTPPRWRLTNSNTRHAKALALMQSRRSRPFMPRIWPTTNPGPSLVPGCYSRDRSLLSCRLSANVTRGALNLYAALPRAYGAIDRTKALNFRGSRRYRPRCRRGSGGCGPVSRSPAPPNRWPHLGTGDPGDHECHHVVD